MRGERWLLRAGEFLAGRAARHLPAAARDERYREWAAELPVILGDPEIKRAAARAARMLWFAAGTLRGAALGPGPARHRGAHRGAAGKGAAGKSARWLGVLAALAVLLAIQAFMVYLIIFSGSLAFYLAFVLYSLASLLAGHLGWGHPLLFMLLSDCGYAVCAACASVAGAIVIRSARLDRRPGMQE